MPRAVRAQLAHWDALLFGWLLFFSLDTGSFAHQYIDFGWRLALEFFFVFSMMVILGFSYMSGLVLLRTFWMNRYPCIAVGGPFENSLRGPPPQCLLSELHLNPLNSGRFEHVCGCFRVALYP